MADTVAATVAFTIQIPVRDVDAADVLAAFCTNYNYQDSLPGENGIPVTNPMTKIQFVEDCVAQYMLGVTKSHMVERATQDARAAALHDADIRQADVSAWFEALRAETASA